MQWVFEGGRLLRRVLRRGSKKGLSRRHLEGRNTPFKSTTPFASALAIDDTDFLRYALARNQYINNLPGVLSCLRPGANTHQQQFPKNIEMYWHEGVCVCEYSHYIHTEGGDEGANTYLKNHTYFSCIRASCECRLHMYNNQLSKRFSVCIGLDEMKVVNIVIASPCLCSFGKARCKATKALGIPQHGMVAIHARGSQEHNLKAPFCGTSVLTKPAVLGRCIPRSD